MTKKKIFLVDDDPDLIFALEAILTKRGYEVITAMNKKEAIKKFEHIIPDVAILDVMMEDEHDGFDLARLIKKSKPDLPIIMLTGISEITGVNFRAAATEPDWLPADEFLDKPISPDELIKTVEELITKEA